MTSMIADAQINGTDCKILTLNIDHDSEVVHTLGTSAPDPSWEHVDEAGHRHRWYGTELPTTSSQEEKWWCEGCTDHHTQQGPELCIWCGEEITPKHVFTGPETVFVPGLMALSASIETSRLTVGQTALLTTPSLSVEIVVVSQTRERNRKVSRIHGMGEVLFRDADEQG
ncbi:hypothetical protein LCGC14_2370780 [marine sediment metagenome]|uniref:Uncharacterized protein n=1 Tax=marine sediment metagenome TaxID=412755 RepID=A0A0F9CR32_9ZZZZ